MKMLFEKNCCKAFFLAIVFLGGSFEGRIFAEEGTFSAPVNDGLTAPITQERQDQAPSFSKKKSRKKRHARKRQQAFSFSKKDSRKKKQTSAPSEKVQAPVVPKELQTFVPPEKTFIPPEKLWAGSRVLQNNSDKYQPYPIQFSIPECKVVNRIPAKDRDFGTVIPGRFETYIFTEESEYYKDYQRSYYAVTCKKSGWDCMRHYEILANGCIPYFLNLEECDFRIMPFLPRELILEAMHLEGVSLLKIDHDRFDKKRYFEILDALLTHVRTYLTTRRMANYLLNAIQYSSGKILYLSNDPSPDYLRCLTMIGLREVLGEEVIDVPKISHIYKNYSEDTTRLYGKGFSYTKILNDLPVDRENIEERIRNKEFSYVIYGSVHRGLRFHDLVTSVYDHNHVIYLCGEDTHECSFAQWPNLFIREYQ